MSKACWFLANKLCGRYRQIADLIFAKTQHFADELKCN